MKETLKSLVRHLLTFLVGLGATLESTGLIGADDVTAANAAGVQLQDVLAGLVAMICARLFLHFGGKLFSGNSVSDSKDKGLNGLLLFLGMAGLFMGLPSCTPAQLEAAKAMPVKACYTDDAGNRACYSSKGGIELEVIGAK